MNDGGPAFPHGDRGVNPYPGMSLRDYFAAQALSGLCARIGYRPTSQPDELITTAYSLADAMIAECNRKPECSKS